MSETGAWTEKIERIRRLAEEHAEELNQSIIDLGNALDEATGLRGLVATDRLTVKEAEIRAAATAIGNNEALRRANALSKLEENAAYRHAQERLAANESLLDRAEAGVAVAQERVRAARAMIDLYAAYLRAVAPSG